MVVSIAAVGCKSVMSVRFGTRTLADRWFRYCVTVGGLPRPLIGCERADRGMTGLMFVGRVGTITVASALALRSRHHHYRLPEERPIVG